MVRTIAKHTGQSLTVNDMVVIKAENVIPLKWSMDRVEKVYADKEGRVRFVNEHHQHGVFRRLITKLAKLPIDQNYE